MQVMVENGVSHNISSYPDSDTQHTPACSSDIDTLKQIYRVIATESNRGPNIMSNTAILLCLPVVPCEFWVSNHAPHLARGFT